MNPRFSSIRWSVLFVVPVAVACGSSDATSTATASGGASGEGGAAGSHAAGATAAGHGAGAAGHSAGAAGVGAGGAKTGGSAGATSGGSAGASAGAAGAKSGGSAGAKTGGAPNGGSAGAPQGGSGGADEAGTDQGGAAGSGDDASLGGSGGDDQGGAAGSGDDASAGGSAGSGDAGAGGDVSGGSGGAATCDTAADPKNCGVCGHDCLGGSCLLGACQPVTLATNRSNPAGLALGGDGTVYWSEGGSSFDPPPAGGIYAVSNQASGTALPNTPTTVLNKLTSPSGIALDDTYVYWADLKTKDGSIGRVARTSDHTVTVVAKTSDQATSLVVSNGYLYWNGVEEGVIVRILLSKIGQPTATTDTFASVTDGIRLAADSTSLFWTTKSSVTDEPLGTGTQSPLYSNEMTAGYAVATDTSGHVYWSMDHFIKKNDSPDQLYMVNNDGTNVVALATLSGPCWGIGVGGTDVYFSDSVANTINHVVAGGAPTAIASGLNVPKDVVVDANAIYWIEAGSTGLGDGSVKKLAR